MNFTMQDDGKKLLKGSPSRDEFKLKHKELDKNFWACDLDFVFITKNPPDIVAALDYKTTNDSIGFSETIAYNSLVIRGIPVFIIQSVPGTTVQDGRFEISAYRGGHHGPPIQQLEKVAVTQSWSEFENWERGLRDSHRIRFSQTGK